MTASGMTHAVDAALSAWLAERAEGLDADSAGADALLPRLAAGGLFKVGVPESEGGSGGGASDAIGIVADLAQHSLAAAFVFWAQRACIACVQASPNRAPAGRLLPTLLEGRMAGAPGLSNAMKFIGGLDRLRTRLAPTPTGMRLDGGVAWASNLKRQGFVIIVAAGTDSATPVLAVPHDARGLVRAPDLDLTALRGTNTASLGFDGVDVDPDWELHPDARVFLPGIRPVFVGLQCGLGLGLARASLRAARAHGATMLTDDLARLEADADAYWRTLSTGMNDGRLRERPRELLQLRLDAVVLASSAVQLELHSLGGRAFLRAHEQGYARRSREAGFLAVVTPTVAQLKHDLRT
jgi:alkylation response protein AidB-like acyl-CoA dehydrogenase